MQFYKIKINKLALVAGHFSIFFVLSGIWIIILIFRKKIVSQVLQPPGTPQEVELFLKIWPYFLFGLPALLILGFVLAVLNPLGREYILKDDKISMRDLYFGFRNYDEIKIDEIKGVVAGEGVVIIELNKGAKTLDCVANPKEAAEEIRKRIKQKF